LTGVTLYDPAARQLLSLPVPVLLAVTVVAIATGVGPALLFDHMMALSAGIFITATIYAATVRDVGDTHRADVFYWTYVLASVFLALCLALIILMDGIQRSLSRRRR
jgi:hypothetical protein